MNMKVMPFKTENEAISFLSDQGCHIIEYASKKLIFDKMFIHKNTLVLIDPKGEVEQQREKPRFFDWVLLKFGWI